MPSDSSADATTAAEKKGVIATLAANTVIYKKGGDLAVLDRIGLFSLPAGISTGDPYRKAQGKFCDERAKGKQFITKSKKTGHDTNDGYFQSFTRAFQDEPYTDLIKLRRQYRNEQSKRSISKNPFRPTTVPPKSSGKGSVYGTIEHAYPIPRSPLPPQRPYHQNKYRHEKINFLTSPPKKGGFGQCPPATIGKPFPYVMDPFDRFEMLERKYRAKERSRNIIDKPFVSTPTLRPFFNPFIGFTGSGARGKRSDDKKSRHNTPPVKPFRPSGHLGFTINPYPIYHDEKTLAEAKTAAALPPLPGGGKGQAKAGEAAHQVFFPTRPARSLPVRSMVASKPIVPPSWLEDKLRDAILMSNLN